MHRIYSAVTPVRPAMAHGDRLSPKACFLTSLRDDTLAYGESIRLVLTPNKKDAPWELHTLRVDSLIHVTAVTVEGWFRLEKVEIAATDFRPPPKGLTRSQRFAWHRTNLSVRCRNRGVEFDSLDEMIDEVTNSPWVRTRLRIIVA